jgi:hypothetical protein
VVQRVIKPATAHTGESYADLLLAQARHCTATARRAELTGHGLRAQGRRDPAGRPFVARATVFVSHAWSYTFDDLVAALMAKFKEDPARDVVYLWNGVPCDAVVWRTR